MIHMLHGAVGSPTDWNDFIPLLESDEVNPVNLYQHDGSGFDAFAKSLNEDSSKDDVLIGYSMGGRLALHAILDTGSKWSKAVIISAHTGLIDERERQLRRDSDRTWAKLLAADRDRFASRWSAQPVFAGRDIPWCRSRHDATIEQLQRCFTCWSLGRQENLLPALGSVDIPVLWITGEEDSRFSIIAQEALNRIPDGAGVTISGAGHRCPWDQPELTAKAISGFLSS